MSDGGRQEVVVVTGASAGVGRATAREFGRHGSSAVPNKSATVGNRRREAPDDEQREAH